MLDFVDCIDKVGPAGAVLVVLSVFGLYLSLKNSFFLFAAGKNFHVSMSGLEQGRLKLKDLARQKDNPLTGIILSIASDHGSHSKDIRAEVAYLFHRNFEKVNQDVTYIRLIAVVSPLLGLLGTVLGIVEVFHVLSQTVTPESKLLAAGLWEALLTTILGLSVAVPALFFYYGLTLKLRGFRIEAVEYSYQVLNSIGGSTVETSSESHAGCREREEKVAMLKRTGVPSV